MASFFRNMNLARAIILVALIGSIGLFFVNQRDRDQLTFLQDSLQNSVPKTVESIQLLSQQYSKLVGLQEAEGLKRTTSPQSYFGEKKDLPGANLGFLEITPSDSTYDRGIEDSKFRLRPKEKDSEFTRDQIAFFMWQLEAGSNRLKITDIDLQLANRKGLKDHDIPEDTWTFSIETTTRQEKDE
jgi:hypothetical protein